MKLRITITIAALLGVLLLALAIVRVSVASSIFYTSPTGSGSACSQVAPCSLATGLGASSPVHAGDTLYLRGGTYIGNYTSVIAGTGAAPVTIRSYPGEWAVIDRAGHTRDTIDNILLVRGNYSTFRDFEIRNSDTTRYTPNEGSGPPDLQRDHGLALDANYAKAINLVVHDAESGITMSDTAMGAEVDGCIIYNNGWEAPDRGHGHGMYVQNIAPTKIISGNIILSNFSHGIQFYGSAATTLKYLDFLSNISYDNGAPLADFTSDFLVGGSTPADFVRVMDNSMWMPTSGRVLDMQYGSGSDNHATVTGNYMMGGDDGQLWDKWQGSVNMNNKTAVHAWDIEVSNQGSWTGTTGSTFDYNEYWWKGDQAPFAQPFGTNKTFAQWKALNGFDSHSVLTQSTTFPNWPVRIYPNRAADSLSRIRGNIAVFNGQLTSTRSVDISSLVAVGEAYEIRNAQNYLGAPVLSGTYAGGSVSLPMTGLSVMQPYGRTGVPSTGPEFAAFVVLAAPSVASPTPTATATQTATDTPTATYTPTNTPPPSYTATATATETATSTPTDVPTGTPTAALVPTETASVTETSTNTPTNTPTSEPVVTVTPTGVPCEAWKLWNGDVLVRCP